MQSEHLDVLRAALADRYRVERELGSGGMATVYLAEDRKHHRQVAIKVLRPELAATLGAERFLREIRLTAQLNHPHILPLLDSGEADGLLYYVMPYVGGESLRDRLNRERQLSLDAALEIGGQVAHALHYAHGAGVLHRDIKPENILLLAGHAVLADFGIARVVSVAGGETLTATGLAVGTPAYMSPEQATAERELDARSDVYALGCVVYEMLAGDPPHIGATAQAIIARRLTAPPLPLRTVRPTVPEALERAVAKALERVPSDRFASAEDFAHALRQVGGRLSAPTVVGGARHRRLVPAVVGAALIGLALVAVWVLAGRRSPTTGTVTHAQITFTGRARSPMLSPDGALLAYVEPVSGVLRVQDLSGRSSIEIARDTHVTPLHRWSPDGKSLLFTSGSLRGRHEHALYRVPRLGGDAVLVWRGLTDDYDFDADGHLLVVQRWDARVLTLDTAQFISIDSISLSDRFLEILTIACSPTAPWCSVGARKKDGTLGNWMISHNGSQAVDFLDWHGRVRWAPDGATVYFLDASGGAAVLASVPFERQGGARSPVTVLSGIAFGGAFDVSADGTKLAYETTSLASTVWLLTPARSQNRPMQRTPLLTGTARYAWASISPDGHQVALLRLAGEQRDLVVLRMGSDSVHQLTHSQTVDGPIVWSPDGNRLAYRQLTSEGPALMVLGTTGGQPERVGDRPAQEEVAWFPDGQRLMYLTLGRRNIAIVNLGTGQESDLLPDTSTTRVIGNPAVSPDGGRVAVFWVRQDGRRGLWLVDLERRSERLLVNDVLWPHQWTAPDRLYAMDGQWRLWRVRTTDGQRTLVAQLPPECAGGSMSRDAQRFVCEVTEERSDIWVATNFDPARGRQ